MRKKNALILTATAFLMLAGGIGRGAGNDFNVGLWFDINGIDTADLTIEPYTLLETTSTPQTTGVLILRRTDISTTTACQLPANPFDFSIATNTINTLTNCGGILNGAGQYAVMLIPDVAPLPFYCEGKNYIECRASGTAISGYEEINFGNPTQQDFEGIQITYPASSSTIDDFLNWELLIGSTSTEQLYARIDYGTSSSTLSYYDIEPVSFGSTFITKLNSLADITTSTLWFAQATLKTSTTTLDVGELITFTILPITPSTFTEENASTTCTTFGFIGNSFCSVLSFLFVPPSSTLNKFSNITALVNSKPPIGYFYAVKNSINGIENSSTTTIINASTSAAFSSIFSPIRTGLAWLLWFLLAWFVFHRIRLLEL